MKSFNYVITDELGIHARPAAVLVKEAANYSSKVVIECNGKNADISKLFALMALGVKKGDRVTVKIDGPDEDNVYMVMKKFFEEKL